MTSPSPFEIEVRPDGQLQYSYEGIPIYLVVDDTFSPLWNYEPRYNSALNCPPCVQTAFATENITSGDVQTPMIPYGWDDYIKKLNGDKWEQAVAPHLAMFNTRDDVPWEQRDNMSSLLFGGGALVRAVPASRKPNTWARIITANYTSGPPEGMPTFWENPIYVQRFTAICRGGGLILHANDFYYPIVSDETIYIQWDALTRFTSDMVAKFMNKPTTNYTVFAEYV